MKFFQVLFGTSIGKKVVMAVTGLLLFGFAIGHVVGNLQIFSHPDKINAYGHFLESLGPGLWAVRIGLLVTAVLHIWVAIKLTLENRAARPKGYANQQTLRATYASRTMRISGFIVLAFIVYHLAHFTLRVTHDGAAYPMTTLTDGTPVRDIHSMMVIGFQNIWISAFYIVSVGLLSWHLSHGLSSMFQSIGFKTRSWEGFLNKAALLISVAYFLANLAIPVSVLSGQVQIKNPNVAGYKACGGQCPACQLAEKTHS